MNIGGLILWNITFFLLSYLKDIVLSEKLWCKSLRMRLWIFKNTCSAEHLTILKPILLCFDTVVESFTHVSELPETTLGNDIFSNTCLYPLSSLHHHSRVSRSLLLWIRVALAFSVIEFSSQLFLFIIIV